MTAFAATRIFTADVDGLITFYERITGVTPDRLHPLFGEISTTRGTLAIASTETVPLLGAGCAESGANRTVSLDFLVDDVDTLLPALRNVVTDFINEPIDLPWGNRSLLFRDPDGNLINFFTPTTPAAQQRFRT